MKTSNKSFTAFVRVPTAKATTIIKDKTKYSRKVKHKERY